METDSNQNQSAPVQEPATETLKQPLLSKTFTPQEVKHHHIPIAGIAVAVILTCGVLIGYYIPHNRTAGNAYQARDTTTSTNTSTTTVAPTATIVPTTTTAATLTVTPVTTKAATVTPTKTGSVDTSTWESYTAEDYNMSFKYPKGWKVEFKEPEYVTCANPTEAPLKYMRDTSKCDGKIYLPEIVLMENPQHDRDAVVRFLINMGAGGIVQPGEKVETTNVTIKGKAYQLKLIKNSNGEFRTDPTDLAGVPGLNSLWKTVSVSISSSKGDDLETLKAVLSSIK